MKKELTPRQQKTILAILATPTKIEASRVSGTPIRTIENWEKDENFRAALEAAQKATLTSAEEKLMNDKLLAVMAIEDVMENPAQPGANTKLKAAEKILDWGLRFQEIAEKHKSADDLFERLHISDRQTMPTEAPPLQVRDSNGNIARTPEEIQKMLMRQAVQFADQIIKTRDNARKINTTDSQPSP